MKERQDRKVRTGKDRKKGSRKMRKDNWCRTAMTGHFGQDTHD
jgi:hypothetical protein